MADAFEDDFAERTVETPAGAVRVLTREGGAKGFRYSVVFLAPTEPELRAWSDIALCLPADVLVVALTLGDASESGSLPAVLSGLGGTAPHLVGRLPYAASVELLGTEVDASGVTIAPDDESAPGLPATPAEFRRTLLASIGYVGLPSDPAPPTETIILKSAD